MRFASDVAVARAEATRFYRAKNFEALCPSSRKRGSSPEDPEPLADLRRVAS
jgi:hypothetical protein